MNNQYDASNKKSEEEALKELVSQLQNSNTKHYICNRVLPQMNWYHQRSTMYRKQYYRWMTVSIILGAVIPIASIFADGNILTKFTIAVLGAGVTATNAYLSLNNSKDLWLAYRVAYNTLLQTLYYYFNDANIFLHCNSLKEKDAMLIVTCEETLSHESKNWQLTLKNK